MSEINEMSWPVRQRRVPGRPCPKVDADPSQAAIQVWHNFTGENAEHRAMMGDHAGPAHARIQVAHDCGWSVAFPAVALPWTYVADAILDHFGTLETAVPRG